jgi:hypothetical protein
MAVNPVTPVPQKILTSADLSASLQLIPSMLEIVDNGGLHSILYGGPGTGKTTLAGLLAEFYHVLWFDGDKGLSALTHNLAPELLSRIHPIRILDNPHSPNFVPTMLKVVTGLQIVICREHGSVDCPLCTGRPDKLKYPPIALRLLGKDWIVVMDSMTQFYASARAMAYYKLHPKEAGKGIDVTYKGDYDYWGICWNICDTFGNYMKDLACNFVTISHETMAEMENNFKRLVPIGGSSNVSAGYGKWFDNIVYADNVNNKIVYFSKATAKSNVQTKSRSNVFLENEETPSLLHVYDATHAHERLKDSYSEWYLRYGWKAPKDRKDSTGKAAPPPPKPKELLP